MSESSAQSPIRPITARAAENGLYLGGCIVLLMLLFGCTVYVSAAALLLWAVSLAIPFVIYRLLRRSVRECRGTMSFAEVWAEGIASFFLGSLIPAALAYLLLRFAFPDFIAGQFALTVETLKAMDSPWAAQYVTALENIRSVSGLPGPVDVAANIISFNIVAGTVISLIVTPFVIVRRADIINRH